MLPVSTPAEPRIVSGKNAACLIAKSSGFSVRSFFISSFSSDPAIGVLAPTCTPVTCVVFTFRHRQPDVRSGSSQHRKCVLQRRNIVRNCMMINLLSDFPLFLSGDDQDPANAAWRCIN